MIKYRKDIDGLRAYAVIAVILFHLGYLPYGYLGVDVFFVISGYLITSIIYAEIKADKFSVWNFYKRRIRRILPLLFFISTVALTIGFFLMLPFDLEDLAESVFATNISANNINMLISSSDYWAVENEYKPLMHTWSLGVEEQFYLIYPLLLLGVQRLNKNFLVHFLWLISLASIILFLFYGNTPSRFYLLHFRLFELSLGGLFAIIFLNPKPNRSIYSISFYLSAIGLLLFLFIKDLNNQTLVLITTLLSVVLIISGGMVDSKISNLIFKNRYIVFIGKISFSLYMWHHLVFAFARYAFVENINFSLSVILVFITLILSVVTYYFVENPFRNKELFSFRKVILMLSALFILSTASALFLCHIGGIYKDFPSLGLEKKEDLQLSLETIFKSDQRHLEYNESIRQLNIPFEENEKPKILIIGDSFGRDVCNMFLESPESKKADLKYFDLEQIFTDTSIIERWQNADRIIFAANGFIGKAWIDQLADYYKLEVNLENIYVFGTKNFGFSNGIYYRNKASIKDYSKFYVSIRDHVMNVEKMLRDEWQERYISLIKPVLNDQGKVRVFDNDGKFISHDTYHFTRAGAKFYADLLDTEINQITTKNN